MKLPIPFLSAKKNNSDYYLALVITDNKVAAVILQASEGNLKKISAHEEFFTTSVEELELEEFINVIDKTISRAEEVLPPDIETHQTVFGLKDGWIEKESKKIKKEYLEKLKKVCDALDLSPIGFMVTTEAVTHLIQDEEGAPLSAVLAEISKKEVTLSLLRGGKIIETVSNPLHESAPATVDKLLSHFTVPVLPARIVLLLNKPDESASQTFISHHWSKSLPFLHMPQVTVLPVGFDRQAVMFGAATQMDFTLVDPTHVPLSALDSEDLPEKNDSKKTADEIVEEEKTEKSGDFGFVIDKDVDEESAPKHHEKHNEVHHEPSHETHESLHHEEHEDDKSHGERRGKKLAFLSNLSNVSFLKNVKLPKVGELLGNMKGNKGRLKIIIPVVALIIFAISFSLFYIYGMRATVALTISPNMVDQEEEVVFSTSSPSDFSKNTLAARAVTATVDGEVSTNVTGKKDIGEKAKGTVTLYNNASNTINLSSGTELKASNGQVFVLEKDVKLASASGDIFTGTKPGTSQAEVSAKELGTEGNLPSGTRFAIGSNSTVAAKNDNAFSGGTKKNVTVVSKEDLTKLRAELTKSLKKEAQSKLSEQAETGETVLPFVGNASLQKEKFDKKDGEEAKKLTLRGTVAFAGMAYTNEELDDYAQTILKNKYQQDVTFAKESIKATVENAKQKDTKAAETTVKLQAGLLPKIDQNDVIANIKDQSLSQAKQSLAGLPQVAKTEITFSPPIPLLPNLFPRLPKQISVEVKTE